MASYISRAVVGVPWRTTLTLIVAIEIDNQIQPPTRAPAERGRSGGSQAQIYW